MTDEPVGQAVYLDTNFFAKAVEGTPEVAGPPKKLIEVLRTRPGLAVTSEITFAEILAPPKRPDALPLHIKRRVYLDLLLWSGFITLIPVSRDVLIETADLRSMTRLKLPDAIHVVSAVRGRCGYIVSGDRDFSRLPNGMVWIKTDAESVDHLVKILA